ncbi:hypothetical protein DVH05_026335 [Phytophthora capsici]|nr:hypothetical protein DVH05_026335 [Phytophthora capsici]
MHDYQAFHCDKECEPDRRDFQLWKVNSCSCHGSNPGSSFARSDSASIRGTRIESHQGSPPSSPLEASPLPFRMSRADVLQSQLSARASHTASDRLDSRLNFTPTPQSQSPSTSASSQGSMVLGRPPLGWQKNMLLSLKDDTGDKEENSLPESVNLSFADNFAGIAPRPPNSLMDPLEQPRSPTSSRDSIKSTIDAVVPIDAKERIMTAVSSQHLAEDSRAWFHRGAMTKMENTSGKDVALSSQSMALQQSWVMSSRTQEILDAVSSSKALYTETTTENHSTKLQEMESVAVYMYTLVQCYKVDEKLRADNCIQPVVDVLPSPTIAETLTKQTVSRRAIAFSPKRAN